MLRFSKREQAPALQKTSVVHLGPLSRGSSRFIVETYLKKIMLIGHLLSSPHKHPGNLAMRRILLIAFGLVALPQIANAQYGYPGGYGRYGYGFGGVNIANDPASGFMAGLGTYARDKGVYQVDAQAQSINLDTMLKWNTALRARQSELRAQQLKDANRQEAERQNRVARYDLESGTTLNNLLLQILQFDPSVVKSAQAKAQLTPAVLHEIPFEWDTEAITICLDQSTGKDSLPVELQNPGT